MHLNSETGIDPLRKVVLSQNSSLNLDSDAHLCPINSASRPAFCLDFRHHTPCAEGLMFSSTAWIQNFTIPYRLTNQVVPQLSIAWIHIKTEGLKFHEQSIAEQQLSQQEYQRYLEFPSATRRHSFLMGRMAIKQALSVHLGKALPFFSQVTILNTSSGVPYILTYPVHLSVSHVQEAAVAVVSHYAIPFGIDLESIETLQSLSSQWLNDNEINLVKYEPIWQFAEEPLVEFRWRHGVLWVAKEAFSKLLGTGLALNWNMLSVQAIEVIDTGWLITFQHFPCFKVQVWKIKHYLIALAMFSNIT